jgi:hypothetical protein
MIGVIVSIGPGEDLDRERARSVAEQARPMFEGMAGLHSKVFTWDEERGSVANVYIWESEQAARAFFTPELGQMVETLYGVAPEIRFVEVAALVENGAAVAG